MLYLIVSVPDHCLFFYFDIGNIEHCVISSTIVFLGILYVPSQYHMCSEHRK